MAVKFSSVPGSLWIALFSPLLYCDAPGFLYFLCTDETRVLVHRLALTPPPSNSFLRESVIGYCWGSSRPNLLVVCYQGVKINVVELIKLTLTSNYMLKLAFYYCYHLRRLYIIIIHNHNNADCTINKKYDQGDNRNKKYNRGAFGTTGEAADVKVEAHRPRFLGA